ncbi:hypothetical protein C8K30_105136 [Promicromonospora sp. AC04]|uniref:hypothetical protein n=1 Tax=Promicromonospora sp. AC04 TaxID=2135723 RepID=UPI000D39123A|nr:hypothetical protein [Promicromonospora sp. AC04]PUB26909.1 hypothetical protein C8K30_105136 [Promicromonospora sp. AC04]
MYNLLIGFGDGLAFGGRVFEHTDQIVREYVQPAGAVDPSRLVNLPTLVMPETGDSSSQQVARIGRITSLQRTGADYRFTFVENPGFPALSTDRVVSLAQDLQIDTWEFTRTHWAVKDVDLYGVLLGGGAAEQLAPQVFKFPVHLPREKDLVAVMMPFAGFGAVYEAIKEAVERAGLRCHRADDIWENHHIMDDVLSLIWRSRVVVSDLSGKNPNVFYETGIAHTIGRDVVPIAQSLSDVPFDLRSIRTLTYHPNAEGLGELARGLETRLRTLTA